MKALLTRLLWQAVAAIVSRPAVAAWLITRSQRTPYAPIMSRDGTDLYMDRWWLFNAYTKDASDVERARWAWLPSIRVHHIVRADDDAHLHDHPWDARTILLRGWYTEERPLTALTDREAMQADGIAIADQVRAIFQRAVGHTGPVRFNAFHRISRVSPGGVYTLWFTWRYQGTWGFEVNGQKVPWREYLQPGARP